MEEILPGAKIQECVYLKTVSMKPRRTCEFQCKCGKIFIATLHHVKSGSTKGCGCSLGIFFKRINAGVIYRQTHGFAKGSKKGSPRRSEYTIWNLIKQRCFNPKNPGYKNYGGRGVGMCDKWRYSFESFFQDMGERPKGFQIDRIDNDGNYEPENCRWATQDTQARNKRNNRRITLNGENKLLIEWSEIKRISISTFYRRLKQGMSETDALRPKSSKKSLQ